MNKLIKYFFAVCVLLVSGHSFSIAHTNQNGIKFSSSENFKNTPSISSGTEKENDDLTDLFVDDDDDDSFKKHLENNNCSTSIFFAQTFKSFFDYDKKNTSFKNSFCFTSSGRYLIYQSIRV